MRSYLNNTAMVAVLALGLCAPRLAGAYTEQLLAAAKKEGKLTMYSTSTVRPGQKTIGQKVKESFPWLEVDEILMSSGGKLLERMYLEIQAGKTPDVADFGSSQMGELKTKGLLLQYRAPEEDSLRPEFVIDHHFYVPKAYRSIHPIYNNKVIRADQLPAGYEGLADPKRKGQTGVDIGGTFWQFWTALEIRYGEEKARDFMRRLGENEARPFFSNSQIRTLVASGELTYGIYIYLDNIIAMQQEGMPIGIWNADPVAVHPSVIGLMKNAPHPNAAKLYVAWFLSKETQTWYAKDQVIIPVHREVENPFPQYFKNVPFVVAGPDQTDPRLDRLRPEYEKFFRVKPQK